MKTPAERKIDTIGRWKRRGVNPGIWTWDELYEIWLTAPTCWECQIKLTDGRATDSRCLDHAHDVTGCFRAILCRGCNSTGPGRDVPNLEARTASLTAAARACRRKNGTRDAPALQQAPSCGFAVGTPGSKAAKAKRGREVYEAKKLMEGKKVKKIAPKGTHPPKGTAEWRVYWRAYERQWRAKKKLAKSNGEKGALQAIPDKGGQLQIPNLGEVQQDQEW